MWEYHSNGKQFALNVDCGEWQANTLGTGEDALGSLDGLDLLKARLARPSKWASILAFRILCCCDRGKHRNDERRTSLGVTVVSSPPCPQSYTQNDSA